MTKSFSWLLIVLWLLGTGCASGPGKVPEKALSQVQTQTKATNLQEKMLSQVSKATFSSYSDYEVGPEDLLEITVYGQEDLAREVRVNGRGEISLPLVGVLKVAGLPPREIETRLAKLYKEGRFLRNPQISVSVKEYRHQKVMVTGAVVSPGAYEVIGPRSLLEVLGKTGGLTDKAGDMVHVIRQQSAPALAKAMAASTSESFSPGAETIVIDLRRLLRDGATALNIPIRNGDVIHVPPARMAYVLGSVKRPGQVPIKDNLTVTQALALTEGLDPMLASNNVTILRFDEKGERLTIAVNLGRVTKGTDPDVVLNENDIVFVAESVIKRFLFNVRNLNPGSVGVSYGLIP